MSKDQLEMSADKVVEIVKLLEDNGITVIIDGGWGVDALLGEQTRKHTDLDVAVLHKDVPTIRSLLEARGYQDVPRDDTWECNFVLGDDQGYLFDLHSCSFDAAGNNVFGVEYPQASWEGSGIINGYPVRCITPEWLVKFHTGYELDKNDYQDVKLLCERYNLDIPEEYAEFIRKEEQSSAPNPT